MPLLRMSLKEMWQRPVRTLLTLLSVVIGAGAIVATAISSRSAQQAQMSMVEAVTGKASLEIQAVGGGPLDAKALVFLGDMPELQVVSPSIRRYSMMSVKPPTSVASTAGDEGESVASKKFRVQLLGVLLKQDQQVRGTKVSSGLSFEDYEKIADSATGNEVWIDGRFAETAGVKIGDDVRLLTKSGVQRASIVGTVQSSDATSAIQSAVVVAPLRFIQRWTRSQGKVDVVQLVLKDEKQQEAVQQKIAELLPEGLSIRAPALRSQVAGESTTAIQRGLLIATCFALIMATFIILNTFQMNVGERKRQLGILRAVGATRRQLMWMILREAAIFGMVGSIVGCVVGYFGARVLNESTAALLQIDIPQGSLTWLPFAAAIVCGILVSLMGAAIPAMMAAYASPSDAMKRVVDGPSRVSLWFWFVLGWILIVLGIAIQWVAAREWISIHFSTPGIVLVVLGVVFLLPASLRPLTHLASLPLLPWWGTETRLARRQILRNPGRSSMTIGMLLVAMAMGLGMASTILDNIRDVQGWYQRSIVGDFFIRATMPDMSSGHAADMPDDFVSKVEGLSGVQLVDTLRFVSARSGQNSVIVVVRRFNSSEQDYFDLVEGEDVEVAQKVKAGQVVVGSVLAERAQLHLGETIELETKEGKTKLSIAGVTNEYMAGGLTIYMESEQAKRLLNVEGTDAVIVRAEPSQVAEVGATLKRMAEAEGLMFQSYSDIVRLIENMIGSVVGGLWAVLALGSVIAAFGLINTLAMNILEQTREIGMLRVIAMTRSQIRRMILAQALIMSVIGILPGVLLGISIATVINLTTLIVTGHAVQFQFYPWLIGIAVVTELVVVFLAAFLPAERAARLNLASALQYE